MKRILFDQSTPKPLRRLLPMFEVRLARDLGWARIVNGRLLLLAEESGFDVLLTGDQGIKYEQNMTGRKIAVVTMSDNHWELVRPYASAIAEAIQQVPPGQVCSVYCGKFVPRKFSKS